MRLSLVSRFIFIFIYLHRDVQSCYSALHTPQWLNQLYYAGLAADVASGGSSVNNVIWTRMSHLVTDASSITSAQSFYGEFHQKVQWAVYNPICQNWVRIS